MFQETLDHESVVREKIAAAYSEPLKAMGELYDAAYTMINAGSWTTTQPGVDANAARTMMALLAKALKTYRSTQILIEHGFREDAWTQIRVLMETLLVVHFVLQEQTPMRVRAYHAYCGAQQHKMFCKWAKSEDERLQKAASPETIARAQEIVNRWAKSLPADFKYKKHWSGLDTLERAAEALGPEWADMYQTLYRHASPTAHAADVMSHIEADDDDLIYKPDASVPDDEGQIMIARELMWHLANRIDERLGLGFAEILAPHKVVASVAVD